MIVYKFRRTLFYPLLFDIYIQLQVSGASNAYTVKSLPGAYLYIPVLEPAGINSNTAAALTSFSTVKRSLSDPEIHFTIPMPFGGHPIILTVNPSSDKNGKENVLCCFFTRNIIISCVLQCKFFLIFCLYRYRKHSIDIKHTQKQRHC